MDGATIGDWFVWCVAAYANALVSGSVIVVVSAQAMMVVVRWTGHGQRASRDINTALTVCLEGRVCWCLDTQLVFDKPHSSGELVLDVPSPAPPYV